MCNCVCGYMIYSTLGGSKFWNLYALARYIYFPMTKSSLTKIVILQHSHISRTNKSLTIRINMKPRQSEAPSVLHIQIYGRCFMFTLNAFLFHIYSQWFKCQSFFMKFLHVMFLRHKKFISTNRRTLCTFAYTGDMFLETTRKKKENKKCVLHWDLSFFEQIFKLCPIDKMSKLSTMQNNSW